MGRGKLSLELIRNEKSRVLTFRKRLKGLMKKAHEFTTLCGVKACMIIYGPANPKGMPATVDIWPPDSAEVKAVIDQYKEVADLFETKLKKPFNLVDFFAVRRRMINDEIAKLRRKGSLEAKYPIRDDLIKNLSLNQVKILSSKFDSKITVAKSKLKTMNRGQYLMELDVSKSGIVPNFSNFQSNLDFQVSEPEFHSQLPPFCPYDESIQFQPYGYDITPVDNPLMTLPMHDELPSGASSNSTTHNGLVPFSAASHYDPPTPAGMVDNGMFNNRWAVPVQYIGPREQRTSGQYQAVASLPSSQLYVPHFGKYYWDIN